MWFQRFLAVGAVALGLGIPGTAQTTLKQLNAQVGPTSYLGVNLQDISADRAKTLKLPEEAGVEITRVEANSPAAAAGLQSGDAVVEYNGQRVEGIEQFSRLVRETPAGREVKLRIFRNGAAQMVTAKIGSHNVGPFGTAPLSVAPLLNSGGWPDSFQSFQSTWRSSGLGLEAEALSGQLADYFGVKEGVLVRSVMKDSAAEKAGIKAGDVIIKAGDSKIATPADLSSRIRPALRQQSVSLTLMRDHKEMTVNVQGEGDAARRVPAEKL
jgi:serine protease Do